MTDIAVQNTACIGAGVIGHSWATLFALHGLNVVLHDLSHVILDRAIEQIKLNLDILIKKSVIHPTQASDALQKIETTLKLEDAVTNAEYVQESVFENYALKQEIYQAIDAKTAQDTIIASSSSMLLMTEIQKGLQYPDRCIIAHPYNPPHLMPLVEVVPGQNTVDNTVQQTVTLMQYLERAPLVIKKEAYGYIGNRLQRGVFQEANDLVNSGIASIYDIDKAMALGPGLRWAIYGPYIVRYFNTTSHLYQPTYEMVEKGYDSYPLLQGRSFKEMVQWRDGKLIDLLRILGHMSTVK
jgi:3-hydroxypropionate dehydrogenase (NADP+)